MSRPPERAGLEPFGAHDAIPDARKPNRGLLVKALILDKTDPADRPDKLLRISSGATMHKPETLLQELRGLGIRLTPELAKRMRRFDWTTDLRYETGRRIRGETRGFLRTCVEIRDWVKGQLS